MKSKIEAITFECTLEKITTDRDGETKLVLLIPFTEHEQAKRLQDVLGENILGVSLVVIDRDAK